MEYDNLVWAPSKSGIFSIKSTHKLIMMRKGYILSTKLTKVMERAIDLKLTQHTQGANMEDSESCNAYIGQNPTIREAK